MLDLSTIPHSVPVLSLDYQPASEAAARVIGATSTHLSRHAGNRVRPMLARIIAGLLVADDEDQGGAGACGWRVLHQTPSAFQGNPRDQQNQAEAVRTIVLRVPFSGLLVVCAPADHPAIAGRPTRPVLIHSGPLLTCIARGCGVCGPAADHWRPS